MYFMQTRTAIFYSRYIFATGVISVKSVYFNREVFGVFYTLTIRFIT